MPSLKRTPGVPLRQNTHPHCLNRTTPRPDSSADMQGTPLAVGTVYVRYRYAWTRRASTTWTSEPEATPLKSNPKRVQTMGHLPNLTQQRHKTPNPSRIIPRSSYMVSLSFRIHRQLEPVAAACNGHARSHPESVWTTMGPHTSVKEQEFTAPAPL